MGPPAILTAPRCPCLASLGPPQPAAEGSDGDGARWSLTEPTAGHRARSLARVDLLSRARTQIGRERFNRVLQRELGREEAARAREAAAQRRAEAEARRQAEEGSEEGEGEEGKEARSTSLRVDAGGVGGQDGAGGPSPAALMQLPPMSPMRRWQQQSTQSPQSPLQSLQPQMHHREPLVAAAREAATATASLPGLHAVGGAASSWGQPSGGRASSPSGRRRAARRPRGPSRQRLPSVQRPYDLVFCHSVTAMCSVEPEIS